MFNDLLEYQIKNFLDEFRLSRSCYTDKLKKTLKFILGSLVSTVKKYARNSCDYLPHIR